MAGAVGAAVHLALRLDAVPDDVALAMRAVRSHRMDGAFEAVERHGPALLSDLEGLVVIVAADIALGHGWFSIERMLCRSTASTSQCSSVSNSLRHGTGPSCAASGRRRIFAPLVTPGSHGAM